jgi:hypothetical protein
VTKDSDIDFFVVRVDLEISEILQIAVVKGGEFLAFGRVSRLD